MRRWPRPTVASAASCGITSAPSSAPPATATTAWSGTTRRGSWPARPSATSRTSIQSPYARKRPMPPDRRKRPMAPEVMAQDLPPNDPDAERAVLGAMLADNSLIEAVTGRLVVGDFYDHAHQILFGLIAREARAGGSVDGVSLFDCARAAGSAEAVGGPAYVARVLDCGPT